MEKNIVYVERGEHHPALYREHLIATDLSFVKGKLDKTLPFTCMSKIRYRQADQECTIEKMEEDKIWVSFKEPQRGVTPRQSIVFYEGNNCLGGAMIFPNTLDR